MTQRMAVDLEDERLILKLRWPFDEKRAVMFASYSIKYQNAEPSYEPPFIKEIIRGTAEYKKYEELKSKYSQFGL